MSASSEQPGMTCSACAPDVDGVEVSPIQQRAILRDLRRGLVDPQLDGVVLARATKGKQWTEGYGDAVECLDAWIEHLTGHIEGLADAVPPVPPSRLGFDALDVWDGSVAPGGWVCDVCHLPVETEPCREHQPKAYAEMRAEAATGALGLRWRVGDLGEDRADRLGSARWSAVGRDPEDPLRGEVRILHVGGQDDGREAAALAIVNALNAATPRAEGEAAAAAGELASDVAAAADRLGLVRDAPRETTITGLLEMRREIADVQRAVRAHRCGPPAPEVVSGVEVAELTIGSRFVVVDETRRPSVGSKVRVVDGDPSRVYSANRHYRVLWRAPALPAPPLAAGDRVESAASLDRRVTEGAIVESPEGGIAVRGDGFWRVAGAAQDESKTSLGPGWFPATVVRAGSDA